MFKGPYDLQNQSSNLLYKSHKTLPDGAPFDFSSLVSQYPLSYRFCPSNTRFLVTSAVGQTVFHLCVFTHPFLCLEYFPCLPALGTLSSSISSSEKLPRQLHAHPSALASGCQNTLCLSGPLYISCCYTAGSGAMCYSLLYP